MHALRQSDAKPEATDTKGEKAIQASWIRSVRLSVSIATIGFDS
jgi:hypothetical protein